MKQKGFAKLIIVAIVILVGVVGYFALTEKKTEAPIDVVPTPQLTVATTSQQQATTIDEAVVDETTNWKTYRNEEYGFEVKYPEKLKLIKKENQIILNHFIPYENGGECDMIGGNETYKTLDDFNVSLELISQNITLKFIDGKYKIGILDGSWVYEGTEGCGNIAYYFSVGNNKTLVVKKAAIQALSGISTLWNREEILKVSSVISPEESKKIFNQILSTFKFIE